jgi:hypothetical protein
MSNRVASARAIYYASAMTITRSKTTTIFMGALFALATAACNPVLDDAALEQQISTGITEQASVGVTAIDCPSGRPLQAGDTFTCSATTDDGSTLQITVTQTDNQGNVHWEVTGQN